MVMAMGCSQSAKKDQPVAERVQEAAIPAFHLDPLTAGSISGTVRFLGKIPARTKIDMSEDPACVEAHHGKALDESLVVSSQKSLANAFIYVKTGLEGKRFETPSFPVVIDQNGCWFTPRVLGIQTNQILQVKNSDPVTHNIHPMAQINREWNHSQGAGDAPLGRKFTKQELMIRVKCNIHPWMHAFIGVVDNPYFAVSTVDGSYSLPNLPPGTYTLAVWQETLGTQEQQVTVTPHSNTLVNLTFKGNRLCPNRFISH
jgi:Polysaccharide lyase family 4, domain II